MTRAALSVYIYGLYLVTGIGVPFLLIPHFALGLFGLSAGDDMWIRFLGVYIAAMGGFYIVSVLTRTHIMFRWTVPPRYATAAFMCIMVALGKAGPALLFFAALDALTASITWVAIRADEAEQDPAQSRPQA